MLCEYLSVITANYFNQKHYNLFNLFEHNMQSKTSSPTQNKKKQKQSTHFKK